MIGKWNPFKSLRFWSFIAAGVAVSAEVVGIDFTHAQQLSLAKCLDIAADNIAVVVKCVSAICAMVLPIVSKIREVKKLKNTERVKHGRKN